MTLVEVIARWNEDFGVLGGFGKVLVDTTNKLIYRVSKDMKFSSIITESTIFMKWHSSKMAFDYVPGLRNETYMKSVLEIAITVDMSTNSISADERAKSNIKVAYRRIE